MPDDDKKKTEQGVTVVLAALIFAVNGGAPDVIFPAAELFVKATKERYGDDVFSSITG